MNITKLKNHSNNIRKNIVKMVGTAGSGHPGGSLSVADIMTVLYFDKMNIDIENPEMEDRDRFILSKGHAAPALYATLAERGFFNKEELFTLREIGSRLQGHPDMNKLPGVDMSTGSLGQGLSVANGMAIAAKLDDKEYTVYIVLGDGEIQEGQIWEAAMSSFHYNLDNLVAFVDLNGLQIDGSNEDIMNISPVDDKFKAFGWNVEVVNGHSIEEISSAVENVKKVKGKPSIIIAKTIKGKGVSFMENNVAWHGTAPNTEQTTLALDELEGGEM